MTQQSSQAVAREADAELCAVRDAIERALTPIFGDGIEICIARTDGLEYSRVEIRASIEHAETMFAVG